MSVVVVIVEKATTHKVKKLRLDVRENVNLSRAKMWNPSSACGISASAELDRRMTDTFRSISTDYSISALYIHVFDISVYTFLTFLCPLYRCFVYTEIESKAPIQTLGVILDVVAAGIPYFIGPFGICGNKAREKNLSKS